MKRVVGWLLSGLVPVALVLAAVRLLLTPLFIQIEYRRPGFPPDPYGFGVAERLYWADIARRYLLSPGPPAQLAALRFADGRPVFDAREVRHLEDVRRVVQRALTLGYGAWIGLGLGAWWARRRGRAAWRAYLRALARGGWLTLGSMALIGLAVLVAFGPFFVFFHRLFFEGDSWLFPWDATLIRLFPETFWVDAFLTTVGLSTLGAWVLLRAVSVTASDLREAPAARTPSSTS